MSEEKESKQIVTVIGGGSWATAIVKILSEQPVKIQWWLRHKEDVQYVKKYSHNPKYLRDVQLNLRKVKACNNINEALEGSQFVVFAVPAAFVRPILKEILPENLKNRIVVSAIKGIMPDENQLITDVVEKEFNVNPKNICLIAGPCHAEEVAMEKQSYLTIGCNDLKMGEKFASLLNCRYVKTSVTDDIYGIEYSAIMKNIVAIASGIAHGLGYGDNFQAVLISNALQEIERFIQTAFPLNRNINKSAYAGDLLVTAYSQFSRNRTFGNMIGRGYSVKSAQVEMNMIAEGYYAVKSLHEINKKYKVELPICKAVYHVLYEKISPAVEIQILRDIMR
jgi:glycerol-3-phosphate dehydrogenase (NAD(P)+)